MENKIILSIAIPALNEESKIEATVESVLRAQKETGNLPIEMILINDGSTDLTPKICDDLASRHGCIRVIHHDVNKGLGTSIRESIEIARGEKWAVLPGDNDVSVDAMKLLFQNVDKADLTMLYFLNGEMRGRKRNIISTIFNSIYLIVFNVYCQYLNGPGTFPTTMLQNLQLCSTRFSFLAEMRVKCLRQGASYCEMPTFMQTGSENSTTFTMKNLFEVFLVFSHLIIEVFISERKKYRNRPIRIRVLY